MIEGVILYLLIILLLFGSFLIINYCLLFEKETIPTLIFSGIDVFIFIWLYQLGMNYLISLVVDITAWVLVGLICVMAGFILFQRRRWVLNELFRLKKQLSGLFYVFVLVGMVLFAFWGQDHLIRDPFTELYFNYREGKQVWEGDYQAGDPYSVDFVVGNHEGENNTYRIRILSNGLQVLEITEQVLADGESKLYQLNETKRLNGTENITVELYRETDQLPYRQIFFNIK